MLLTLFLSYSLSYLLSKKNTLHATVFHRSFFNENAVGGLLNLLPREVVVFHRGDLGRRWLVDGRWLSPSDEGYLSDDEVCPRGICGIEDQCVMVFLQDVEVVSVERGA